MLESEREKLLKIEERLARRVIGQEDAIRAVANAIRRSRAGLADKNRPIGAWGKQNWPVHWQNFCSMTKTP